MSRINLELKCILCDEINTSEALISVGAKGMKSLHSAAISRGEHDKLLQRHNQNTLVHESCRKNYVNKKRICQFLMNKENITSTHEKRKHAFRNDTCLFCHQKIFNDSKNCQRTIMQIHSKTISLKFVKKEMMIEDWKYSQKSLQLWIVF
jgi:hypothetical protein